MTGQIKALIVTIALAGCASALGKAVVRNNCNFEVTLWPVGHNIAPKNTLQHGQTYSEQFSTSRAAAIGRALKITRDPDGLFTGKPQTDFAYNLDGGKIWYDLSDVNGDPFAGHKLVVVSAHAGCPSIVWPNGIPQGNDIKNCPDVNADVILTLCAK